MPLQAFILIVLAAFAHAAWNLLAKRAAHCRHLIWFSSAGEAFLFLPIALRIGAAFVPRLNWRAMLTLFATGALHLVYTESLLRGYRAADLSVVYPVARGIGPLLSFVGAIFLLGERPSAIAGLGALLVAGGILIACGGRHAVRSSMARTGLLWGAATGLTIACYTLVDGYSVRVLLISPLLVEYAGNLFRTIALSFEASRQHYTLIAEYRRCWKEALGISILTPAGYILVLFAVQIAPVSHVAPAREMSMMIGAWFGARLLREGHLARRLAGSALIVAGVAALTVG